MVTKPHNAVTWEQVSTFAYWTVRGLQTALAAVALGLMSTMFYQFQHVLGTNVPVPFTYNFACALLTFLFLPVFILFDLPPRFKWRKVAWLWEKEVPWWIRWVVDGIFWVLWVAGASTSELHCGDLCATGESRFPVGSPFAIWFAGVVCECNGYILDPGRKPDVSASEHWVYQANRGIDIIIVLLFTFMIIADPLKPWILPKLRRHELPPAYQEQQQQEI